MLSSWRNNNQLNNPLTIGQARQWLADQLPASQGQQQSIMWLLSFILASPASQIIAQPERRLSLPQWRRLQKAATKLANGYPLAYLTGQQDFYDRTFAVSPAVLIPRPESECLIDIIKQLRSSFNQPTAWLDIGTGSGCLIISAALELTNDDYFGGSDISRSALKMAQRNGSALKAKINWRAGSLLRPWLKNDWQQYQQLVIIANLPYVKPEIYQQTKAELRHEPKKALLSGHDGLKLFRRLAKELPTFIANHPNCTIHLITESDLGQVTILQNMLTVGGLQWQKSFPDLTGRQRFNWWHN